MGDNDWDIGMVVRSSNVNRYNNVVDPNFGLETFENNDCNFLDGLLAADITILDGLSEILSMDFSVAHQKKLDDQSSEVINPTNHLPIISDQVNIMDQIDNQQLLQLIQPTQFSQPIFLPPLPTAIACVPAPQEWTNMHQQFMMRANIYPNFTLLMKNPTTQTRGRKNQSIWIIYELLQEELTNDMWTWIKYGEKTIKGSPFPRNYYKCSTSNFCKAKKQIEKSPKEQNIYLVAYSGVHNHDPPTHRSPLNSFSCSSKYNLPKGVNIVPRALSLNASSFSSKRAKHSGAAASPIGPTTSTREYESASQNKNKMIVTAEEKKAMMKRRRT